MKIVDLHSHTIYSDGKKAPAEFVAQAYKDKDALAKQDLDLRVIALTDHDTLNAIEPVQRALKEFEEQNEISDKLILLPGIEISTNHEGQEIHILGYFPNTSLENIDAAIGKDAQRSMELKNEFNRRIQLQVLVDLTEKRYSELTGKQFKYELEVVLNQLDALHTDMRKSTFNSKQDTDLIQWVLPLPRDLIRKALARIGPVPEEVIGIYTARKDPENVLGQYYQKINRKEIPQKKITEWAKSDVGKCRYPGDIVEQYISSERAVELITSIRGKAFFAHPYEFIEKKGKDSFEKYVLEVLVPAGLSGIECYYMHHDDKMTSYLLNFSKQNNLLVSGGTDNHIREKEMFGIGPNKNIRVPFEIYEQIVG